MSHRLRVVVSPTGESRYIHDDVIYLTGDKEIRRASHVEIKEPLPWWAWRRRWRLRRIPAGCWYADMRPTRGPVLGPFLTRSYALEAEKIWLERHWLAQ